MEKKLFTLLDVIKRKGSIKRLIREGMTYLEIGELTNNSIEQGFISNTETNLVLTEKGEEKLKWLNTFLKKTDKKEWIELSIENKISQIHVNDIYLPNREELHFD